MMRPVTPTLPRPARRKKLRRVIDCRVAPGAWSLADIFLLLHAPGTHTCQQSYSVPLSRIALRHQSTDTGNEFPAIFHRVGERVIATDEQAGCPKIVVGDQSLCDRFRGAYKGSGIAPCARDHGQSHPQAAVIHLLVSGGLEKPERSIILWG